MTTNKNENLNISLFRKINTILERDSTTSSYKFALLRGVIEIIQDGTPYTKKKEDFVEIPFLLLIEKWLIYYYGIFSSTKAIPQITMSDSNLAIEKHVRQLIEIYEPLGGITSYFSDIRSGKVPSVFHEHIFEIFKSLKETIYRYPMKHIGKSVSDSHYSVFYEHWSKTISLNQNKNGIFNLSNLIHHFGYFRLSRSYYDAFEVFGHFIIGTSGLITRWSDFSSGISKGEISKEFILNNLTNSLDTKRITEHVRKIALNKGLDKCIWTQLDLSSENLAIDHVLPFSVYHNNDLWNLMPTIDSENGSKSDKIPSERKFLKAKSLIQAYWDTYIDLHTQQFKDEIQLSLLGSDFQSDWKNMAFQKLIEKANYLKELRGLREWY